MTRTAPRAITGARRWWGGRHAPGSHEDGAHALESAVLMAGIGLPLFIGAAQFVMYEHGQNLANTAAQVGIERARLYHNPGDGAGAARAFLDQTGPGMFTTLTVAGGNGGGNITITVDAATRGFLGLPLPPIQASASAPVEEVTQ